MAEEERPVSELLLELLENPSRELRADMVRRIIRAIVEAEIPEGMEELGAEIVSIWDELVDRIVTERLTLFITSDRCEALGLDAEVCRVIGRLRDAYKALLKGIIILDDAGRAYVRLKHGRCIAGLCAPRGSVVAIDAGDALVLYAIGEAEVASIKPLKE